MTEPPPFSASSSSVVVEIDESLTLIPGLPNKVAAVILSLIPYSHQARLKPTCKSWRLFLSSKTIISLRQERSSSHLLCIFPQDPSLASPFLFDRENLAGPHSQPRPQTPTPTASATSYPSPSGLTSTSSVGPSSTRDPSSSTALPLPPAPSASISLPIHGNPSPQ